MVKEKLTDSNIRVGNVFSSTKCTKGVVESMGGYGPAKIFNKFSGKHT